MKLNLNLGSKAVTVLNVAGVALGLVGTVLSSIAQHQTVKQTIAKEVQDTLNH